MNSVKRSELDKTALPKDVVLAVARNAEDIIAMRAIWEQFKSGPNSDIDHYLHVIAEDQSVVRPHVTLLERDGKPVALAVGRIENYRFSCKFGYKNVYSPHVKALGIVYDGLLGDFSIDNSKVLLDSFIETMRLEDLDLIRFSYLRIDSPMYELVRKKASLLVRDHLRSPSLHWRMNVPKNIEGFYRSRSRKHRYWMRRIRHILENEFPNQVHCKIYTDGHDINELIVNVEIVAKKTYQWGLGQGFKDSLEMRKRLTAFVEKKQLRAYILYIKNEPRAFWTGRSYRNVFYLMHTGYDPQLKKYELGTILFIDMLQDLAENTTVEYVDFGFSDQPYKARFGDEYWKEETVHLFAAHWRGLRLNAIRSVIGLSWVCTLGMLDKLGIKNRMKRLMRDRAIRGVTRKRTGDVS